MPHPSSRSLHQEEQEKKGRNDTKKAHTENITDKIYVWTGHHRYPPPSPSIRSDIIVSSSTPAGRLQRSKLARPPGMNCDDPPPPPRALCLPPPDVLSLTVGCACLRATPYERRKRVTIDLVVRTMTSNRPSYNKTQTERRNRSPPPRQKTRTEGQTGGRKDGPTRTDSCAA